MKNDQINVDIATKVMGWKLYECYGLWVDHKSAGRSNDQYYSTRMSIPKFCTDLTAAWEIVEKLSSDKGSRFHLDHGILWKAQFIDKKTGLRTHATAKTAARAICLAALKGIK